MGPRGKLDGYRKSHPLPGLDSLTVQPVTSRHADYTIPAHDYEEYCLRCDALQPGGTPLRPYYSTLKKETVISSETLVNY